MAKIVKYVCDVCGMFDDDVLYLVGSDAAEIHICNYCLDEMNKRAAEYLEKCERNTDFRGGANVVKF